MEMGFNETWPLTGDSGEALRPLAWAELCARLSAAQDLRRERLGHGPQDAASHRLRGGSFHQSAAMLLRRDESSQEAEPEQPVNPMPSVNGKQAGTITVGSGDPHAQSHFAQPHPDEPSRRELP